jgi:hypothetical protein
MSYQKSSVYDVLKELQAQRAILIAKGDRVTIWSPGHHIETRLKRAVYRHKREVLKLLDLAEISTCVNPALHAHAWKWSICRDTCDICASLKPYVG